MISYYKLVVLVVYYIHEYSYTDAKGKKKLHCAVFPLHPVCVSTRINYCKSLLYTIEHFNF